jgi:RHS repeat-associated protein
LILHKDSDELVPLSNWRGKIVDGICGTAVCTTSQVHFPGRGAMAYAGTSQRPPSWWGSLIEEGRDGSGLQYMRNRYYDPQTGRFTQEDPIGFVGGLNLYGYADGDPVTFSDPFGLCPHTADKKQSCWQQLANWGARTGRTWAVNVGAAGEALLAVAEALMGGGCEGRHSCGMGVPGGFKSFGAFKAARGAAGAGREWHHIVGQTTNNVGRFGVEAVHSSDNLISLDVATHRKISGFYSSKQAFTNGKTVREWLGSQSWDAQREFGLNVLRRFGVIE